MVYYLGAKTRFAKELLDIMLPYRKPNQTYVEPFVGGGNVICRVPHDQGPRIGADVNEYMVALLDALGNKGWQPPEAISEAEYKRIKKNPKGFAPEIVAFAATGASHGSLWLGPYAKQVNGETPRVTLSRQAALADAAGLKGAIFVHSSYDALAIPPSSLIYCDPPYVNTAGYVDEHQQHWRAYRFWQWADKQVEAGHTVFVSEYTGPSAEAYPLAPIGDEHQALLAAYRDVQREIVKVCDDDVFAKPPPALEARRVEIEGKIKEKDAVRGEGARAAAARWKVVWEKEVVVNFSSDIGEGEGKKVTEKLFHREA